ncbi:hypothetical protein GCM10007938_32000 [Vibrio zhanjiangensis]|uniref:Uncharacterized protein n=1 Tax=Vibrio zhanjiangensis TaxID=1046128 RepID=A0ABQ6F1P1_9VIBR|nr:hypothetical protein [Vibrio zhanjiangensis]GLT19418.1 hypothetical protein GCM10007938_32000 [Vibrio zhanjiangensis]
MNNRTNITKLLGFILALLPGMAYAGHTNRDVTITQIHPISSNRPASPNTQDTIRVYVNPAPWGDTACRQDAADLLKEDSHLLSSLLMAWTTGKSIKMEVDDRSVPTGGNDIVCQLTALYIK